ncbi:uncharacterized protein LOC110460839 [Mizuhopecten yessoensis]|uniref:Uncharacterized protein n=1 Tax=Mizuhopecten yessoensis TaxID=6573 RepID=A0A210Q1J0_MIZYE|nr:uncharacterized protein LOC110460839 [Mizuhopecten yessoensis]OWF42613.1 hypothetical protein KP79_PYT10213 [Mizuhopecten yessoensis]
MVCPVGNRIIVAISVTFILQLAGLCLPNWVTSDSGGEYGGLFAYCVGPTCDSLPLIFHMDNADYGGVVSLHLVGTGLLLITVFVGSILAWRSGWTKVTFLVMSGFLFTAATCICCGVTWFVLNFSREGNMYLMFTKENVLISNRKMMTSPRLSFALFMCAVSGLMSLVLGVVTHTVGKAKPRTTTVKYGSRIFHLERLDHVCSPDRNTRHVLKSHARTGILVEARHLLSKKKLFIHVNRLDDRNAVT